jgi:hypothetical protein
MKLAVRVGIGVIVVGLSIWLLCRSKKREEVRHSERPEEEPQPQTHDGAEDGAITALAKAESEYLPPIPDEEETRKKRKECFQCITLCVEVLGLIGLGAYAYITYQMWGEMQIQTGIQTQSSKDSTQAFIDGNRAYVFVKEMPEETTRDGDSHVVTEVRFFPSILNSGKTPAYHVICTTDKQQTVEAIKNNLPIHQDRQGTALGPSIGFACDTYFVKADELLAIWKKERHFFLRVSIDYSDAFPKTPIRHSESCYEMSLRRDPSVPFNPVANTPVPNLLLFEPNKACGSSN